MLPPPPLLVVGRYAWAPDRGRSGEKNKSEGEGKTPQQTLSLSWKKNSFKCILVFYIDDDILRSRKFIFICGKDLENLAN